MRTDIHPSGADELGALLVHAERGPDPPQVAVSGSVSRCREVEVGETRVAACIPSALCKHQLASLDAMMDKSGRVVRSGSGGRPTMEDRIDRVRKLSG